jgi:hypothetical protein
MFSYNHDDPARRYLVSRAAHNVVVVDGVIAKGADARIERHRVTDHSLVVVASHDELKDVRHRRTLIYVRPGVLLVHDMIVPKGAERSHRIEVLFQIGPRVTARAQSGQVALETAGRPVAQLVSSLGAAEIVSGQREPMQGWYSPSWSRLAPTQTIRFQTVAASAELATLVRFETAGTPLPEISEFEWKRDDSRLVYAWREGGTSRQVQLFETDLDVK